MSKSFEKQIYGDTLVLGLGKTGLAATQYLLDLRESGRVSSVTVYGGLKSTPEDADAITLEQAGARVICGTEDIEGAYGACVASPGISEFSTFYLNAQTHCELVMSEPELAWRESPERWVGITGTNGKTTTTTLVRDLLRAGGCAAEAVGNIGTMAIGEVARRQEGEWLVAEMSSFQCAGIHDFHPKAAILLNVTPDHLYWHNTMENYAAAKEMLFANMDKGDLAIVSTGDEYCRAAIEHLEKRGLAVCKLLGAGEQPSAEEACAAWQDETGQLVVRLDGADTALVTVDELTIKGEHNVENALAAAAAALACGVAASDVRAGLKAFAPLEHRIEPCGELNGVHFVNDSKATNTDAVSKALTAFEPGRIIVLLGGHDKGTDLSDMCADVVRSARVAVCFGEAGMRIAKNIALAADAAEEAGEENLFCETSISPHLKEALDTAIKAAIPGDTILLSPACSSFDEFSGFEERGEVFKQLVSDYLARSKA